MDFINLMRFVTCVEHMDFMDIVDFIDHVDHIHLMDVVDFMAFAFWLKTQQVRFIQSQYFSLKSTKASPNHLKITM